MSVLFLETFDILLIQSNIRTWTVYCTPMSNPQTIGVSNRQRCTLPLPFTDALWYLNKHSMMPSLAVSYVSMI